MSIIDPEEGHFNDVDGRRTARPSARARSVGTPEQEELDEEFSEEADPEHVNDAGSAQPDRPSQVRSPRHRK